MCVCVFECRILMNKGTHIHIEILKKGTVPVVML